MAPIEPESNEGESRIIDALLDIESSSDHHWVNHVWRLLGVYDIFRTRVADHV
jgi:hypothetical protein